MFYKGTGVQSTQFNKACEPNLPLTRKPKSVISFPTLNLKLPPRLQTEKLCPSTRSTTHVTAVRSKAATMAFFAASTTRHRHNCIFTETRYAIAQQRLNSFYLTTLVGNFFSQASGYSSSLFLALFPDFTNIPELSFKLLSFLVELKFYVFVGNKFSGNKLNLSKLQLEGEC